jgi:hypothetical protein
MAQEIVNLGNQPNDGTGDSIRDAFSKVNNNFNEVYSDVAVIQTFIGTNTTIADSIAEIQGFSSVIANFSATQVLFQSDLNSLTTRGGYFGSVGYTGSRGSAGYNGSVGYAGSMGFMGYAGSAGTGGGGYTGSAGYDGSMGFMGYAGSAGTGGGGASDRLTTGSYAVILSSTGALKLPSLGVIINDYNTNTNYWQFSDAGTLFLPEGSNGSTQFTRITNTSSFVNLNVQHGSTIYGGARIGTNIPKPVDIITDFNGTTSTWRFDSSGNLTLPGGIVIKGTGQTWSADLSTLGTSARTEGTSYRNTTGASITVKIGAALNGGYMNLYFSTDNSNWNLIDQVYGSGGATGGTVSAVIPNGNYYKMTSSVIANWSFWRELTN